MFFNIEKFKNIVEKTKSEIEIYKCEKTELCSERKQKILLIIMK